MDTQEILKRVRKIEIKTRGLSSQLFSGEYHSAFKGRGMAFSEVREYQPGDEIRSIDWNVTARLNHPYIKVFEEERELTVMLLIDVSKSESFGTREQLKRQLITEVSAVLAFSAIQNNDKIGVVFFSDQVEKFIPPKKGRSHILRIIRELIDFEPEHGETNLSEALKFINSAIKKRSIVFLLSDFIDDNFQNALKIANKKHDLVALHVRDRQEEKLPNIGLAPLQDPESGKTQWVDTSSKRVREEYEKQRKIAVLKLQDMFTRSGVDTASLYTGESYTKPLMNLFKQRELRR
ncbi:DUF58 domain-containing protein [Salibacter halophilus]|jgi:uncharacterized protein (DUF58 family)|uniref:DUF58 domain-containing protein n=1 Tax=Salibacter halophilus TaxID=1803916 RepID=A0A6N6MAP2_9FLAO|nr:DUF58 domain-containing protein [Salibacter halophilus]KAB1065501.1 DUF58 domain-containing protein [Salibacter halophilus]